MFFPFLSALLFSFYLSEVAAKLGASNRLHKRQDSSNSSATTVYGDSKCVKLMCIEATVNGSTVEYVMQSTGSSTLGWMAMGFGSTMANSPMVIMWSNSDSSITLSQRIASGEVQPTVQSSPTRAATVSTSLSSTSGTQPQFVFTIPADSETEQAVIWAFGTTNPGSSAVDANLQQHLDSGTFTLDLTKVVSSGSSSSNATSTSSPVSSTGSSSTSSGSSSIPLTSQQKMIVAHAVLSAIGFIVLLPAGALTARFLRTLTPSWFHGHWFIQVLLAGPIIIVGVALGINAVAQAGGMHLSDGHMKWGVAIFVLYFAQCSLGAVIHWVKPKSVSRRPPQNYLHAIVGILTVALGFYQVRTGYTTEWMMKTGRGSVPKAVNIVWYIWVVLIPLLYVAGLSLLPKQFRQEQPAMQRIPSDRQPVMGQRPLRDQRPYGQNGDQPYLDPRRR